MDRYSALQELTWNDVRKRVNVINPTLAKIIDKIDPDSSHTLFYAKYPYGSQILINGKMFLPNDMGELIPFEDPNISINIKNKIGYNLGTNPMSLVLSKTLDLFINLEDRIALYGIIEEGRIFGTWQVFDNKAKGDMVYTPIPLWDLTAGGRSVFMLPKITEVAAFSKIRREFDLKSEPPKNLKDHWQIFKEIANHPTFGQSWDTELLFFSKKWIESIHDPAWHELKTYISDIAWGGSEFWRNQFCWELTFSRIQSRRGIRPCPYATDIANHLLGMSIGAVPGFQALVDNRIAPVDGLMKVFEEIYGSRYAPIIIGPATFNVFAPETQPVFYSFQYHTALKLSQKSSNRSSTVTDMYNIRALLNKYIDDIQNSELSIEGTVLYEIAKKVKFNFYHYSAEEHNKMINSNELYEVNQMFQNAIEQSSKKTFPKNAPFLNGCIEVTRSD